MLYEVSRGPVVLGRLKSRISEWLKPSMHSCRDLDETKFLRLFDIETVSTALGQGKTDLARSALLDQYGGRIDDGWPEPDRYLTDLRLDLTELGDDGIVSRAERVLEFELSPSGIAPALDANRNIAWSRNVAGKNEWLWMLNRHAWWVVLGLAYRSSGDERFARAFVTQLRHWIRENPPLRRKDEAHHAWRLMEVALRLRVSWIPSFALFSGSKHFDDDTKLLMLRSIVDHMRFLSMFHTSGNHLLREQNGLATACCVFFELRDAAAWRDAALIVLNDELRLQVNDDGSHVELSTGYQWLVIDEFEKTYDLLGRYGLRLPYDDLGEWLGRMCLFLAHMLRPDGTFPQINDGFILWQADRLEQLGEKLGREDVVFLASGGKAGRKPDRASIGFGNAGLFVLRDRIGGTGHALLFDAGPYGGPHGHEDKLSIEVSAFGLPMIVDPGSYTYERSDPFRDYFVGSQAHNTLLVDQLSQVRRWDADNLRRTRYSVCSAVWESRDRFDFVRATYRSGYGAFHVRKPKDPRIVREVAHQRTVVFVKPDYWVVFDAINSVGTHDCQVLFHVPPEVRIHTNGPDRAIAVSSTSGTRLALLHEGNPSTTSSMARGEHEPIQGWYSPDHHYKEPSDSLMFESAVSGNEVLVTVLYPLAPGSVEEGLDVRRIEVSGTPATAISVHRPGGERDIVMVSEGAGEKRFAGQTTSGLLACFRMDTEGAASERFTWQPDSYA